MILQALAGYYDRLAADPSSGIATQGYTRRRVSFAMVLSHDGELVDVQDLREPQGRKMVGRALLLPTHEAAEKRTVTIAPFFLWDKTAYVLGATDEPKVQPDKLDKLRVRNRKAFEEFRKFQHKLGDDLHDPAVHAVLRFLDAWRAEPVPSLPHWVEMAGTNVVFRLDGELGFVHERSVVRLAWTRHAEALVQSEQAFCLVTGRMQSVARLHPAIKGVRGAKSSGAALSSFNLDASTSHRKEQNHNAPVGQPAAFAYTTALNHLLARDSGRRLQVGDATTVLWAGRASPAENFMAALLGDTRPHNDEEGTEAEDRALAQQTRAVLQAVRDGRHPPELGDPRVPFYVLGLGANASRLVVRFWHVGTVGNLAANLGQHFTDLELERRFPNEEPEFPTMWRLLFELVPKRHGQKARGDDTPPPLAAVMRALQKARSDDIPPPLAAAVMRALLTGADYPPGLYNRVMGRLRADHSVTYLRVALLKACLVRRARKTNQPVEVTVSLNEQNTEVGYLLGRLFAVMETAQRDALGKNINATIKDRFYGAASATPGMVFPRLISQAQHHIAKAKYGAIDDRHVSKILELMPAEQGRPAFPRYLNSTEQGFFALGYYHQRTALYRKRVDAPADEGAAATADDI